MSVVESLVREFAEKIVNDGATLYEEDDVYMVVAPGKPSAPLRDVLLAYLEIAIANDVMERQVRR